MFDFFEHFKPSDFGDKYNLILKTIGVFRAF